MTKKDVPYPQAAWRALMIWYVLATDLAVDLDRYIDLPPDPKLNPPDLKKLNKNRERSLARELAADLVTSLKPGQDHVWNLGTDIKMERELDQYLNRTRARALDRALDRALELRIYLEANRLLVSCLYTDCYISRSTRQQLLDGLLALPGEEKEPEKEDSPRSVI